MDFERGSSVTLEEDPMDDAARVTKDRPYIEKADVVVAAATKATQAERGIFILILMFLLSLRKYRGQLVYQRAEEFFLVNNNVNRLKEKQVRGGSNANK
jgi:hypothetical protein